MDAATRAELLAAITQLFRRLKTAPEAERPAIEAQIRGLADRVWPNRPPSEPHFGKVPR